MKKIIFILSAVVCICTVSCQNNSQSSQSAVLLKEAAKDTDLNVSHKEYVVNVPAGWRETDTSLHGVTAYMLFAPKNGNGLQSSVNIINGNMQGLSLEDYANANLTTLQSLPSFKELGEGYFETDAHVKAKWLHYSATMNGYNLDGILYIIPIDGIAYDLTGACSLGSSDKYRKDFDAIAKSFHLK